MTIDLLMDIATKPQRKKQLKNGPSRPAGLNESEYQAFRRGYQAGYSVGSMSTRNSRLTNQLLKLQEELRTLKQKFRLTVD